MVCVALAMVLAGCEESTGPDEAAAPAKRTQTAGEVEIFTASVGEPAPAFTLEDQDGKKVSLRDFSGKVIVLEWTNPDCPFVRRHYKAGTMKNLVEKFRDQGVAWLAIDSTYYMDNEANKKWVDEQNITWPVLNDSEGQVGTMYQARTTPHLFIIDKKGTLVYSGAIDDDPMGINTTRTNYVEQALTELMDDKEISTPETKSYGCSVKYKK